MARRASATGSPELGEGAGDPGLDVELKGGIVPGVPLVVPPPWPPPPPPLLPPDEDELDVGAGSGGGKDPSEGGRIGCVAVHSAAASVNAPAARAAYLPRVEAPRESHGGVEDSEGGVRLRAPRGRPPRGTRALDVRPATWGHPLSLPYHSVRVDPAVPRFRMVSNSESTYPSVTGHAVASPSDRRTHLTG